MPEGQTRRTARGRPDPAIDTALRGLLSSWRLRVWIALLLTVGVVMLFLPLFRVLGFELAVVSALFASIAGLDLGVGLAGRAIRASAAAPMPPFQRAGDPLRRVWALTWRAAAMAATVTLIPALLAVLNGVRIPTCDWGFGVRAYLSLTTASAVLGAGAGVAIGLLAGRRRWLALLGGLALVLGLALAAVWRFYSEPPVFWYSPLIGYFPGNLYDEDVQLGAALYWSRLEQLLWVTAMLTTTAALVDAPSLRPRLRARRPGSWRWSTAIVMVAAIAGGTAMHLSSGHLGYAIDAEDIQDELGGKTATKHFVIYYATGEGVELSVDVAQLAQEHELRLFQVAATLDISADELRRLGKIRSYYFKSPDQKARLMGARNVEMAKPWRREIYITDEGFPHPSLRHEIAHVVAGSFGSPWFHVSARRIAGLPLLINPGLVEGLAVAVDWPGHYRNALTPHQAVKAMQAMGSQPSVREVMSFGFLTLSSARGYTTAGSFVRFLLDRDGPAPLKLLYASGGDFKGVYGRELAELEDEWRAMLATVPLSEAEIEIVRERFRRGGMFSRPCPHAVAARRQAAGAAAGRGDRAGAVRAMRDVCNDAPEEPSYRLELADLLVGGDDDQRTEAIEIYERIAADRDGMTSYLRGEALAALARVAAARADWADAEARLAEAALLPLEEGSARQHEAMLFALRHRGPAGPALRGYFFGGVASDVTSAVGAPPENPLGWATAATALEPILGMGWYLRGLQQVAARNHAAGASELERSLRLGLPSRRFVRNAARVVAVSAWQVGDREVVRRAIELLAAPDMTEMDHLLADDWRERVEFSSATSPGG